jgi:hypothetical protein
MSSPRSRPSNVDAEDVGDRLVRALVEHLRLRGDDLLDDLPLHRDEAEAGAFDLDAAVAG